MRAERSNLKIISQGIYLNLSNLLFKMKKQDFLEKIYQLNIVVKINLSCCEILFKYLGKHQGHEHVALLKMLQKGTDYFNLALINHFYQAVLILNSLLNPRKSKKTKEISPYNKTLNLGKITLAIK